MQNPKIKFSRIAFAGLLGLSLFLSKTKVSGDACVPLSDPLTFRAIRAAANDCGWRKLEDLIGNLPTTYKNRYALIHHSRSLQEASPDYPRVISFGENADFILAFHSDPKAAGYDVIEAMQFDNNTKTFDLREISEGVSGLNIGPSNPAKCLSCHMQDPRPNWDGYFLWPGAIGAEDEAFSTKASQADPKLLPIEKQLFARFLAHRGEGRMGLFGDYPLRTQPTREYFPDGRNDFTGQGRPNLGFGSLVGRLNGRRLFRKFHETMGDTSRNYLILGALVCSYQPTKPNLKDITQFVPASARAQFPIKIEDVQQSNFTQARRYFVERVSQHLAFTGAPAPEATRVNDVYKNPLGTIGASSPGTTPYYSIERFLWATQGMGLDLSQWTTEFSVPGTYSFHMISSDLGGFQKPFTESLLATESDPELRRLLELGLQQGKAYDYLSFEDPADSDKLCERIQLKSLQALSATP